MKAMQSRSVLIVDDDASTCNYLSRFLGSRGFEVDRLHSGDKVIARLSSAHRPSVVILDLVMPGTGGLEVLGQMRELRSQVPAIVLSGVGQASTVVRAMKLGAVDYLVKPFNERELESSLHSVLDECQVPATGAIPDDSPGDPAAGGQEDFTSENARILRIKKICSQVADTDVPVVILGESGVGKEVLSLFIHRNSSRRGEPFVKVNCAALPTELLESELFGHERGAFTGALREKPGKFELAAKGTLLLDEIGEMSSHLQAKLLHVLQDGEYNRLGGTRPLRATCRIIAATNKRLDQAVANGDFREDLFYRLNVVRVEIPPLRDRPEDIPALSRLFLEKYRAKYRRGSLDLPPNLIDAFLEYSWPGNVRQLENVIRRYVVLPDLDLALSELRESPRTEAPANQALSLKEVSAMASEEAEKELILNTLDEVNWNRKEAARRLDICYKSLLNRLRRWQVPGRTTRGAPPEDEVESRPS